ncbi:hypothetical protein KZZ52_53920 [Dactylosporangium sp. AC04546]|uniref:hypothetical protein n=1 Tax=Dactylosporangium sp. AC04546 TaxID=2862460 RepID=UPI001EDCBF37|nr:hypothetical protein [Dactylosporangium sp. AC04546]WVK82754.1 hypothetical protein KZZ52_53920 [Dactylosporangium sp. AC04546]
MSDFDLGFDPDDLADPTAGFGEGVSAGFGEAEHAEVAEDPMAGDVQTAGYDSDGDGTTDVLLADQNGDGRTDIAMWDTNDDGLIDKVAYDRDYDGRIDLIYHDDDFDGEVDRVESSGDDLPGYASN